MGADLMVRRMVVRCAHAPAQISAFIINRHLQTHSQVIAGQGIQRAGPATWRIASNRQVRVSTAGVRGRTVLLLTAGIAVPVMKVLMVIDIFASFVELGTARRCSRGGRVPDKSVPRIDPEKGKGPR